MANKEAADVEQAAGSRRLRRAFGAFFASRFSIKIWHVVVIALIGALLVGTSQGAIGVILLVGASLLVLVGAWVHAASPDFKHSLEGLAALLSCLALFAAGYWYFIERRGVPKLNVESEIEAWPIGGGGLFVRVETQLENVGTSKYEIDAADDFRLEVGQVYPVQPDADVKKLHAAFLSGRKNASGAFDLVRTDQWPLLAVVRGEVEAQVESGETDRRYFKTIVACKEGQVLAATVLVRKKLNLLDRLVDAKGEDLFWKDQSLSEPVEGCRG